MSNPVGSFIWYELMTSDPDAAAKFYGSVIGWSVGARSDSSPSGKDYRMIGVLCETLRLRVQGIDEHGRDGRLLLHHP